MCIMGLKIREMGLWLLISKGLKGCDKWMVQPFLFIFYLFYLLELNLVFPALLCCASFEYSHVQYSSCPHSLQAVLSFHSFSATSELPWFGSANLFYLMELPFPLLSASSAASLTPPRLIFYLLNNLSALTGCISHLLWHENMAPISWRGGMEGERWRGSWFGQSGKQSTLSLWAAQEMQLPWLKALELESEKTKSFYYFSK